MPGDAVPATDAFGQLHPAVQYHVVNSLGWTTLRPTQLDAIGPIHAGCHCLLLAPTAGGKTEAAIIPVLSRMLQAQWPGTSVLYVCPIKALLNNLEARLSRYAGHVGRTVAVWHGDVSASRKKRVLAQPPDILLTTPESIEGMLISPRIERDAWFGRLRVVVIDELHAFAGDDRGWHLRALLSRLERYAPGPVQRLGLSATVRNPDALLAWMAPTGARRIVGTSSVSADADVVIDLVGSIDNAALVVSRLHRGRKRLVFCDARSVAERLGSCLHGLGVRTFVSHGSLSADERRRAETAFAEEKDCVIVATSTLELGIDVGDLDHVLQIDAPSSVSSFLQRMGRTGRRAGSRRNCTFLALDDRGLLLAMAIVQLWREAWVEDVEPPPAPWGVVAQQALAIVLEQGQIARADLAARLRVAFQEQTEADFQELLDHLMAKGFLVDTGPDVLIVGPTTETEFGRGHYRELLASFSGNPLLTGRHGSTEIGLIDPSGLAGSQERPIVLLAGRSWVVREIDWRRRVVWLEPSTAPGRARWQGAARDVSGAVAGAMRRVLQADAPPPDLSRRARAAWESLRERMPVGRGKEFVMAREGMAHALWTYAGTRVNRTLARAMPQRAKFDALKLDWEGIADAWSSLPVKPAPLTSEELQALAPLTKFHQLLPQRLLSLQLAGRLWETTRG